ncbi:phage tail protein [Trinickia symbiotica]|uniref:Phage tail protein n=1 Tax=Trinickia symbiotica TaxID=863227 RepID=A0A2T3XSW3_9BURK|nr:phage tail protein [Trinickia symbiotica]PTB19542.1 phage tail protein [Trinickia symbiotica]
MNKPASLRRALVTAIPSLEAEPDKLAVFIDQGSIIATGTRSLSFEYRYTAHALLLDFAGDADTVFVALVEWARTNQPDLVTNPDERAHGITFEVDILNHATADLSIKLALTESVAVTTGPDGNRVIEHVDDTPVGAADTLTWVAQPWTT